MIYAAYGSNMNTGQMAFRCPNSKIIGTGVIKDWKLYFNHYADIMKEDGDYVPVVLWNLNKKDIKRLDSYEGFPSLYVKEKVKVTMDKTGKICDAMVYVMANQYSGIITPPTTIYLSGIREGYAENDIAENKLFDALVESLEYYDYYYVSKRRKKNETIQY